MTPFQRRLIEALKPHGSVVTLATKVGVDRKTIENWRSGVSCPTLDKLDKIAEFVGCEPWELIKPDESVLTHASKEKKDSVRMLIALNEARYGFILRSIADLLRGAESLDRTCEFPGEKKEFA